MSALNIAAYCRVSTNKEDQLNSLETQKKFFVEYAEKHGHTLVRLYADEGLSGTKIRHRKQFQQMMSDAELGLFEMVTVKDISRLARNTVDLLQSVRRLKALGIQTLFLTANMTSMGDSEFILTVFGALAQEESANTSKRVKFGKRLNAEKGRVPNLVYGYDKIPGDYFHLSVNETEAAVVRRIYGWYLEDGHGGSKIADLLNHQGVKTKRNCDWSQNAVCRILTNPIYVGQVINGKQEVADFLTSARVSREKSDWLVASNPELRIISDEQFRRACQLMASRGKLFHTERKRHSNKYLFSTLIRCKECGWSFRRTSRTYQHTYVRWVCSKRNGQGAHTCDNTTVVDEAELIAHLDAYFRSLLQDRKRLEQALRQAILQTLHGQEDPALRKGAQARLARLEKSRQKLLDLYADDLITRQELDARLGTTRAEMGQLELQLRQLGGGQSEEEAVSRATAAVLRSLSSFVSVERLTNAQLRRLIEKIEVDKDGNVDVYLRFFARLSLRRAA